MTHEPAWLLDLARQLAAADPVEFWFWTALCLLLAVASFAGAFAALHKARLIENTPTSRIRSAAQGYVELDGLARLLPGPEIHSPLSGARCCWWKYRVERQETTWRNGKRSSHWRTIESGTSDHLFLLADDTDDCIVDPAGAIVYPSLKRQWRGHAQRPAQVPEKTPWLQFGDYRYREELLQVGDPVYALGWFRTQSGHTGFDESGDVAALLREWKSDEQSLLARFDADGSGHIDLQEWEAARRAALDEVRTQHVHRSVDPDVHVLCRPPDRRPFLLSTLSQQQLARRFRAGALLGLCFSIGSGTCGVFALTARGVL